MTIDFSQSPNYDAILEALHEKTKAGKITWSATSEPSTFFAAVKGTQTYRLCRQSAEPLDEVLLTVLDENGKVLFPIRRPAEISDGGFFGKKQTTAGALFTMAERMANRVDEKVDQTLELLNTL